MKKEISANTTLSHYRIVSKLGAGGMGEVYLAHDTSELGRTVALKILPAEVAKDPERLQRFIQEARTVSNLNHPNILTVHEFGQTDSASFMATEYVDGVTLRQHISNRRLKLVDVLDVAIQIVGALNAAHEAGVTHRDLKPENVMVRKDHIVKVLDFGLAKLSEPRHVGVATGSTASEDATRLQVNTTPGIVMGTVSYMSPEQSEGKAVDLRTDIWSTGVVLYEMIAGVIPFQGNDIHRQIIAIQEADPTPLSQQVEGVPERLEEIVTKCLAKEKDERYQTAKDLLIDLRNLRRKLDVDAEIERTVAPEFRATSGAASSRTQSQQMNAGNTASTIAASTASSAEYLVRGVKRHKIAVGVGLVMLAAFIGGLGLYLRGSNTSSAIKSIAVLPFENRSNTTDTEYLSDGLAESLIYRLSQLPDLKVSSASSVMRYKGQNVDPKKIAAELGVQAVLSGRLMQRGENLSISIELIDASTNNTLWGEQYERKISDLLSTQREIAATISEKLQLRISGSDRTDATKRYTENNEAYQNYLRGRHYWNKRSKEGLDQAIAHFEKAIDLDPAFALAHLGIADCYLVMPSYAYMAPKDAIPRAIAAAKRAMEIDPDLAEAHSAYGSALTYELRWKEAGEAIERAIALNPRSAQSHYRYAIEYLAPVGRIDEAIAEIKQAVELEPLSIPISANVAGLYIYARRYEAALEQALKTYSLEPGHATASYWLGWAYVMNGKYAEAISLCEKVLPSQPDNQDLLQIMGYSYAKSGRPEETRRIIAKLNEMAKRQYVVAGRIATLYGVLGENDKAFADLERSYEAKDWDFARILIDPTVDSLRDDPRFSAFRKKLNQPQ